MSNDLWIECACHDASCAPPPVGTGGSRGGPSRSALSPKAGDRKNPPQSVVKEAYELRKHGLREAFDGPIGKGLHFDEVEVEWVDDDYGWHVQGNLKNEAGDTVAYFERAIGLQGDKLVARHETLKVEPDFQGNGYAQALNNHLVHWYGKVGVDRIETRAGMEVGPYAWAVQGYRINSDSAMRRTWVERRLDRVSQVVRHRNIDMLDDVNALRRASIEGEDVQPLHVASLGQDDPDAHWVDPNFGDMWPGKFVLVDANYIDTGDFHRDWDGVYYLDG